MDYLDAIDTLFYARLAREVDGSYDWENNRPAEDLETWIQYSRRNSLSEEERRESELITKVAGLIDVSNRAAIDEILKEIASIRTAEVTDG